MKQPFRFEASTLDSSCLVLETGERFTIPKWARYIDFRLNGDIWAYENKSYGPQGGKHSYLGKVCYQWEGYKSQSVDIAQFIAAQNLECGVGKTSVATSGISKIEEMPIGATITGICNGECGMEYFRIKPERYEVHDDIITILCGYAAGGRSPNKVGYGLELNIKRGTNVKYEV